MFVTTHGLVWSCRERRSWLPFWDSQIRSMSKIGYIVN